MKILTVRFMNLNSLRGEWEVDLRHRAFTSDGIFAITGPTGAGKSTILDALCLALYGRTPRLPRITRSSNEIMSRHTGECCAEVLFETRAGRFRCHWSQHRSRRTATGELQQPRHEIAHGDTGEVLDATLKGVAGQIEQVTGMDFDRFTRSMLLAQGGFAVFLQAPPDERAPILEQITGTEIYSRISVEVHERRRREQELLRNLDAETAGIALLSDEQQEELLRSKASGEREEREGTARLEEVREAIGWVRTLGNLEREVEAARQEEEALRQEAEAFRREEDQLMRAERAAELEGVHATCEAVRRSHREDAADRDAREAALPRLQDAAAAAEEALAEAEGRHAAARREAGDAVEVLREARALDQALKLHRATRQPLEVEHTGENQKRDAAAGQLAARREERTALAGEVAAVQRYFAEHQEDALLSGELTGIIEQLRELETLRREIAGVEEELAEAVARRAEAAESRKKTAEQRAARAREVESAEAALQSERERLERLLAGRLLREYRTEKETLLREQAYVRRILELEDHRAHLVDGTPCPLCGSEDHPFARGNVPRPDEREGAIAALTGLIEQAEKQQEAVRTGEEALLSAGVALSEAERAERDAQHLHALAEERCTAGERRGTRLQEEAGTREKALLAAVTPLGVEEVAAGGESAVAGELRRRHQRWQEHTTHGAEIEKRIGIVDADILRLDTVIAACNENLAALRERLADLSKEISATEERRRDRAGDINPDEEEARLNREVTKREEAVHRERQRHQDARQRLHEGVTRLEALVQRMASRTAELDAVEEDLSRALAAAGFPDEEAFLAARRTPEERAALKGRAAELERRRSTVHTRRKDREEQLAAHRKDPPQLARFPSSVPEEQGFAGTLDSLESRYAREEAALGELRHQVAAVTHTLQEQARARERMEVQVHRVAAQRKELHRWDALHELIGSADGKKYRNFAQGLTFELMIAQANRQLQNLTDRYLLVRDSREPLELSVVDNFQGGEIRSTKNLSGGESFIVSLALALGLSHMSGSTVPVESLFLDEGFGTLDEEALDTALETLAGLHHEGRMIGIISHVGALKERITAGIQVVPAGGGRSTLTGPGCTCVSP